jgi:hypothetical protein
MTVKLIHTDIDHCKLADEMYQLFDQFDLYQYPQVTLTSLAGDNDWTGSTGKTHLLKYPERSWTKINQAIKDTYIHECIQRYPSFYRWRLMKVDPRSTYTVHKDGNNILKNFRLHIPVVTNPDAYLAFFDHQPSSGAKVNTRFEHLAAGFSYEVNTTGWHTAFNFGTAPRYHIVGVRYENLNNRPHQGNWQSHC